MSRIITIHYPTGWIQLLIPDWLDRASMKNIRLALLEHLCTKILRMEAGHLA